MEYPNQGFSICLSSRPYILSIKTVKSECPVVSVPRQAPGQAVHPQGLTRKYPKTRTGISPLVPPSPRNITSSAYRRQTLNPPCFWYVTGDHRPTGSAQREMMVQTRRITGCVSIGEYSSILPL